LCEHATEYGQSKLPKLAFGLLFKGISLITLLAGNKFVLKLNRFNFIYRNHQETIIFLKLRRNCLKNLLFIHQFL